MATRRPASSRSRTNSNAIPPSNQQPRPRSVMAKSSAPSTSKTGEELERSASSQPSVTHKPRPKDESDTRINVIIRCRGRSEREMQENSPSIVHIEGSKAQELTIEAAAPTSTLGVVTLSPTRTYPFDLVLASDATQSMVYHDVVAPMLDEVLMGYNCTLFAYGQTGTGKTYTMVGDLTPTPMGNPSPNAGIIPRVLFRLFHELEKSYTDFVVKCSFVELYNEELRDLLSQDFSLPTALTQPMGKEAKAVEGGLKIFDEANKRGVFIQGLEEIAVKDSRDALALLTKGSERRQIAATKFNDHSSRSHSVFSITVHLKEKTNIGDDLLKVGKLNLVDLAGSENIGRSGAENKRAREAGMINQSLLTLGRVINALVDKAQHIPYRESKLTRLLQDSLGGRTKTCIIATISPARSNLEETLSTLDYALRAKSIKNKPELNQRMTRNSLLKEYVAEIDRLKADLLATREKNGMYFSEERWNEMTAESELRETELKEAKKQVVIIENQMRNVRDEFDQSIAVLKKKDEEIQHIKGNLQRTEETLHRREEELIMATTALNEEVIICQAHQETEKTLDSVARGLKNVTAQSLRDVAGLFDKLDRKNQVLQSNKSVVVENEKQIHSLANALMKKLVDLSQLSQVLRSELGQEAEKFRSTNQEAVSSHMQEISSSFSDIEKLLQQIGAHNKSEDSLLHTIKETIETSNKTFTSEILSWNQKVSESCTDAANKLVGASLRHIESFEQSVSTLSSSLGSLCAEVQEYLNDERESMKQSLILTKTLASEEISRLKQQNDLFSQLLIDQKNETDKAQAELLHRISGLLGEFSQKRDDSLRESVEQLQHGSMAVEERLSATYKGQTEVHDNMTKKNRELSTLLAEVERAGTDAKKSSLQASSQIKKVVKTGVDGLQRNISGSLSTYSTWVQSTSKEMHRSCGSGFDEHSRVKRARIEATNTLNSNVQDLQVGARKFLASSSKLSDNYAGHSLSWLEKQGEHAKEYEEFAIDRLELLEQAANTLALQGVKTDAPTGSTPRKRKWQYTDTWAVTKSREDLLSKRQMSAEAEDEDVEMDDCNPSRHSKPAGQENRLPSHEVKEVKADPRPVETTEPLLESKRRNNTSTIPTRARRAR